tara:strand:- start:17640 stop:18206 length:567 start_codon:yes stop_codon:yes gene_type:complete
MKKSLFFKLLVILCLLQTECKVNAAENIMIYKGTLSRTITIESLENLVKTKKSNGSLKNILRITNQKDKDISELLEKEYELPIVLTSKLIHSKIGTIIISRISKIIYPNKTPQKNVSVPAIRSAIIKGIVVGEGKLNLLGFLKHYPNKNIAINYNALNKVLNKIESMTDLVNFFTGSPLDNLKNKTSI